MSDGFTQEEEADYFNPNGQHAEEELFSADEATSTTFVDYDALINAPDYSTLVRGPRSKIARDYELKVRSILKSGALGTLRKGNLPDSAAIFRHGPAFAAAAGDLADKSDQTRHAIDLLTAPENPYVAFAMVAIALSAQLFRNHQPEIETIHRTRREMRRYQREHPEEFAKIKAEDKRKNVEIRLPFGRRISLRVGLKHNPLRGFSFAFRTQTREPAELVTMVFSDQKLVAALKKQGIDIVQVKV